MRYELIDNQPRQITVVTINGRKISNPSDALLEANNIGYTRTVIDPPEVTDETKKLLHSYAIENGSIVDVWSVTDKMAQELIEMYTAQIVEIYNAAETYKNDGKILYPATGKEYIPRWCYEFYNAVLIKPENYFPTLESTLAVSAVDGTTDNMTLAEFVTFYAYLAGTFMQATGTQNAEIKVLTDKIKALRNE